jgi:hypothetical protein
MAVSNAGPDADDAGILHRIRRRWYVFYFFRDTALSDPSPTPAQTRLATLAATAILLAGLALMGAWAAYDAFDADELQHAHLAWLVAGGKIIFRDFWDNHGPLYALANGTLLGLTGAVPGMDLLFWCRGASLAAVTGILALTWQMARTLGLPAPAALAAPAIAATLVFVQDRAPECRPDTWQNLFWFAGLWLVLVRLQRQRVALLYGAGALFGLAVLSNVKAGLGPALIAAWYLAGGRLHGLALRTVAGDLARLAAGAGVVYGAALGYFAAHDAVAALHEYSVRWNFLYVATAESQDLSAANIGFLVRRQWPFVLLVALGAAAWIGDLSRARGLLPRAAAGLVAVLAAGLGLTLALDLYFQFFLIFLPLWAIVAAYGILALARLIPRSLPGPGHTVTVLLVAVLAAWMLATAWRLAPKAPRPALAFQHAFTRTLLRATPRDEPVGVIWDICGGFMFNEPLQFYWGAEASIGATAARHGGTDPFGQPLIDALERGQVRFVIGRDSVILARLPEPTQRYLRERYHRGECLWTRKR